mgnify:CR=1 FL=1
MVDYVGGKLRSEFFLRVVLIASTIVASGSARASLTSAEEIVISLGSPSTRFLPLTTRFFSSSPGYAEPIFHFDVFGSSFTDEKIIFSFDIG